MTQPVVTVLLSLLVLAEVPSALEECGMVLVLESIAVGNLSWLRSQRT